MTDAVQIAILVDPSEQQEKFDSLLHTRTNANATVNEQRSVKYDMTTTQKRL